MKMWLKELVTIWAAVVMAMSLSWLIGIPSFIYLPIGLILGIIVTIGTGLISWLDKR